MAIGFYSVAFAVALFVGAIFLADAIVGFWRAVRGTDDEAVSRRLSQSAGEGPQASKLELLRARSEMPRWLKAIPFSQAFIKLIVQSGLAISPERVLLIAGAISFAALAILIYLVPGRFFPISLIFAMVMGAGPVFLLILRTRTKRRKMFEEQLPDAIDLMVRSLKIGHPMSGAMQVIAREMQDPIGA